MKKKSASEVFNPSFFFDASFIGNDTGFSYDPSVYAKKKRPTATTLDEKIGKVRADRKKKSQVTIFVYLIQIAVKLIF